MIDPEYFERKKRELGFDRVDHLAGAQAILDEWYGPGSARARRLHQNVLRVVTSSAAVAGNLRFRQVELLEKAGLAGTRLAVLIGDTK